MAAFSAKNAKVQKAGAATIDVLEWELTALSNNPDYRSSATAGWTGRVAGHKDVTGSFRVNVDDSAPIWDQYTIGEAIADLRLYEDATNFHSGPALIDSMVPRADIDGDGIMEVTVNFSATGAWTLHGT